MAEIRHDAAAEFFVSDGAGGWTPIAGTFEMQSVVDLPLTINTEQAAAEARRLIVGQIIAEPLEPVDTAPVTDTGRENIALAFARPPR